MTDEQNQDPQPTTQEAGSAALGESVPSATGTASIPANPSLAPSNPATAESPSAPLTEQPPASPDGSSAPADLQGQLDTAVARIAELEAQLATAQDLAAHPIHALLGEIESEIERPGAILKTRVKSLINDARALF